MFLRTKLGFIWKRWNECKKKPTPKPELPPAHFENGMEVKSMKVLFWGASRATLNLRVVNLSPRLGMEPT